MRVSVVVPAWDRPAWPWVRRRYRELHPGWEVVESSAGRTKGAAVDAAVRASSGDMLVIADADSFVAPGALVRAVALDVPWVVPFDRVWRLTEAESAAVLAGPHDVEPDYPALDWPEYPAAPGGGIVVCSRTAYETAGGIDPRFVKWGGEDRAFGWALDTLVGGHALLSGPLWHLWHPHGPRKVEGANEILAVRYKRARGRPDAMRALVAEHTRAPVGP